MENFNVVFDFEFSLIIRWTRFIDKKYTLIYVLCFNDNHGYDNIQNLIVSTEKLQYYQMTNTIKYYLILFNILLYKFYSLLLF